MSNYVRREWLNGDESASTGSVVAFWGKTSFGSHIEEGVTFFEIADCRSKVCLHKIAIDSPESFIAKMRKLAKIASEFADFLETNEAFLLLTEESTA